MARSTTPGLSVAVAGDIWWGGFTAELTITNTTGSPLSGWSYSFDSPHQLNSAPWGATLLAEPLDNGLTRYTLSGDPVVLVIVSSAVNPPHQISPATATLRPGVVERAIALIRSSATSAT